MNNYNMDGCSDRSELEYSEYSNPIGGYEYELNLMYDGAECQALCESVDLEEYYDDDNEDVEDEDESVYDESETLMKGECISEDNGSPYEDENQYFNNDPLRSHYINSAIKSLENHKKPAQASYIYKKNGVRRGSQISLRSTLSSNTKVEPNKSKLPKKSKPPNTKNHDIHDSGDGPNDLSYQNNLLELLNLSRDPFNVPIEFGTSNQSNLTIKHVYSMEDTIKAVSENRPWFHGDCINLNMDRDDSNNVVSLCKDDFTELRNLQKTKRMICGLLNKQIEKVAKLKNVEINVSQSFSLKNRVSSSGKCSDKSRKTRLESLNNLQSQLNKLMTLENIEE